MRGRIKVGAAIMQDFAFGHWPQCKAPKGSKDPYQADDADMMFEMTLTNTGKVECTAPGFGARGHYGNGSILCLARPLGRPAK